MNAIIGIDLGTTFSAIAKIDDHGQPSIVPADGERITASCVHSPKNEPERLVVGGGARNKLETEPGSVVERFKRDIGNNVTYDMSSVQTLTPVSASAAVLRKLAEEASKTAGAVHEVVITTPANFAERQRKATIAAGEQAGLKVLSIINEPTAAILAYASQKPVNGTVLIYDLGGGTFDVTIAKVRGTDIECLTSEGDSRLGGVDFDLKVAEIIDSHHAGKFGKTLKDSLGIDSEEAARQSPEWQLLLMEAEKIKRSLSRLETESYRYRDSPDGPLTGEVTRNEFENAISSLIARTEMRVETALDNLDMEPSDIDDVLLVGGSSRIPAVRQSLERLFSFEPSESVNPDEAVALGAAVHAGLKTDKCNLKAMQREKLERVSVADVANHYYGTIAVNFDEERNVREDRVTVIIPKDTKIPASRSEVFYTASEGQEYVNLRLTQSAAEESDPEYVHVVHEESMGPLPSGRPSGQPVEITYSYDSNQIMQMEVKDQKSGKTFKIEKSLSDRASAAPEIPEFRID